MPLKTVMKTFTWIIAIVLSGLLLGTGISYFANQHFVDKRNGGASGQDSADASNAAPSGRYQIGDRLPQDVAPATNTAPNSGASANAVASANTATKTAADPKSPYREILWDALLAPGWDPMLPFKGLKLDQMEDGDPRAAKALDRARVYWDKAPVNPKINDVAVKIPGFVVSLEREGDALKEFLVVPYYGGCIHVPPPPANQIIHVHSSKAISGIRTMDAVWISGTIKVATSDTMMGVAGYSMLAQNVELYKDTGVSGNVN